MVRFAQQVSVVIILASTTIGNLAAYSPKLPQGCNVGVDTTLAVYHPHETPATAPDVPIQVYVDGSGSMLGYFHSTAATNYYRTVLQELEGNLRLFRVVNNVPGQDAYFRFGAKVHPVADPRLAGEASFYARHCPERPKEERDCDIDTSDIGLAVDDALKAGQQGGMGLVFTDLYFSSTEVASGDVEIATPLATAVDAGLAVGILGFKTPFQGRIFDLPGYPRGFLHEPQSSYKKLPTSRPVFLIMIGSRQRIVELKKQLDTLLAEPSPAESHFALYSADLGSDTEKLMLAAPNNGASKAVGLRGDEVSKGVAVRQLPECPSQVEYRVTAHYYQPPTIPLALSRIPAPGDLMLSDIRVVREKLWMSTPDGWLPRKPLPNLVSVDQAETGEEAILFADSGELTTLPSERDYLAVAEFRAQKAISVAESSSWLAAWSLPEADVDRIIKQKPPFFPARNLDLVSKYIDAAIRNVVNEKLALRAPVAVVRIAFTLSR
jgi:hypothetical protein